MDEITIRHPQVEGGKTSKELIRCFSIAARFAVLIDSLPAGGFRK
jgi:hypothetical protein